MTILRMGLGHEDIVDSSPDRGRRRPAFEPARCLAHWRLRPGAATRGAESGRDPGGSGTRPCARGLQLQARGHDRSGLLLAGRSVPGLRRPGWDGVRLGGAERAAGILASGLRRPCRGHCILARRLRPRDRPLGRRRPLGSGDRAAAWHASLRRAGAGRRLLAGRKPPRLFHDGGRRDLGDRGIQQAPPGLARRVRRDGLLRHARGLLAGRSVHLLLRQLGSPHC